jgi:hypothetical protein
LPVETRSDAAAPQVRGGPTGTLTTSTATTPKGTPMYALQPALVEQPDTSATAHAAFYAAAHARLQGALGNTGRRVALDTAIDLYRANG